MGCYQLNNEKKNHTLLDNHNSLYMINLLILKIIK